MTDRITLDFENELITIETDTQESTQSAPELKERKQDILTTVGLEEVKLSDLAQEIKAIFDSLGENNIHVGKDEEND